MGFPHVVLEEGLSRTITFGGMRDRNSGPEFFQTSSNPARSEALTDLGFPVWQADDLLEEFAMYRRGAAAGVEAGVLEALSRSPRSFGDFARDYQSLFA